MKFHLSNPSGSDLRTLCPASDERSPLFSTLHPDLVPSTDLPSFVETLVKSLTRCVVLVDSLKNPFVNRPGDSPETLVFELVGKFFEGTSKSKSVPNHSDSSFHFSVPIHCNSLLPFFSSPSFLTHTPSPPQPPRGPQTHTVVPPISDVKVFHLVLELTSPVPIFRSRGGKIYVFYMTQSSSNCECVYLLN